MYKTNGGGPKDKRPRNRITYILEARRLTSHITAVIHTSAGDMHRWELFPSRPNTLISLNPQLSPNALIHGPNNLHNHNNHNNHNNNNNNNSFAKIVHSV